MNKGDKFYDVPIIDYTYLGLGVAKIDGITIFIKYAKLGELVNIEIIESKKKFIFAKLLNEEKVKNLVKCQDFLNCGGCQLQHLTKEEQLQLKLKGWEKTFNKEGLKLVEPEIISGEQYNYRNKVLMPFIWQDKKISVGFYQEESNDINVIQHCHLQTPLVNEILQDVCQVLTEVKETVYNINNQKGNLKSLLVRTGQNDEEILITLIITTLKLTKEDKIITYLIRKYPQIKGIVVMSQQGKKSTNKLLYGKKYIYEKLNNYLFPIDSSSFFQVNTEMAEKMFSYLKQMTDFTNKVVLDSYCGIGNISIILSDRSKKCIGVELNSSAIKMAKQVAKENKIKNCVFINADIDKYLQTSDEKFDIIIVDPPRKGLSKSFREFLLTGEYQEIIYISCNYATLTRDLKELNTKYQLISAKGFDLFPQTHHLEIVVKLVLKGEK